MIFLKPLKHNIDRIDGEFKDHCDKEISILEIKTAIKKLKLNDGLTAEFF